MPQELMLALSQVIIVITVLLHLRERNRAFGKQQTQAGVREDMTALPWPAICYFPLPI